MYVIKKHSFGKTTHLQSFYVTGIKSTQLFQNLPGTAVAIDADIENDLIFWSDVSPKGRGIYRSRYSDGSRITRIVSYGNDSLQSHYCNVGRRLDTHFIKGMYICLT